jgi:hypothetical protein
MLGCLSLDARADERTQRASLGRDPVLQPPVSRRERGRRLARARRGRRSRARLGRAQRTRRVVEPRGKRGRGRLGRGLTARVSGAPLGRLVRRLARRRLTRRRELGREPRLSLAERLDARGLGRAHARLALARLLGERVLLANRVVRARLARRRAQPLVERARRGRRLGRECAARRVRLGRARDVDGEKLLVQRIIGVRARAALNRECTRGVGRRRLDPAGRVAAQRREVVRDARVERRYYALERGETRVERGALGGALGVGGVRARCGGGGGAAAASAVSARARLAASTAASAPCATSSAAWACGITSRSASARGW